MKKRHRAKSNRDKFDVLSALWVLACNDPISIMSYNGIKYRLKLPADYDIENLVEERGELCSDQEYLHGAWKNGKLQCNHKRVSVLLGFAI